MNARETYQPGTALVNALRGLPDVGDMPPDDIVAELARSFRKRLIMGERRILATAAMESLDPDGRLLVAEGIETALSLLSGLPDAGLRIWAALSTSGMARLALPPDPGELVIAPDGDTPGMNAATKLADRACAAGWRVSIMDIPDGADWNDIAQKVAA